jgi:hypothetical protein
VMETPLHAGARHSESRIQNPKSKLLLVIILILGSLLYPRLFAFTLGLNSSELINPALATGYEAVEQNPAQLGLPGTARASVRFVNFAMQAANNAIELGDYGRYIIRPTWLTQSDKDQLLSRLGTAPLLLRINSDLRLAYGQFYFLGAGASYSARTAESYPKELFDIVLNGNEPNRRYDLSGWGANTLSFCRVSLAGGWAVNRMIRTGVGLSWLKGTRYSLTTISTGDLLTTPYAITGFSHQTRLEADGGDGFGLTLGSSLRMSDHWRAGLTLRDLIAGIWWHRNPGTRDVDLVLDSLDATRFARQPSLDSFVTRSNVLTLGGTFFASQPGVLALGLGYQTGAGWTAGPDENRPGGQDERGVKVGIAINLPLQSSIFVTAPPLAGISFEWRPTGGFGTGLSLGWRPGQGWIGNLAFAAFTESGFEFKIGGEMQGRNLPAVRSAQLDVGMSYIFE